MIKTVWRKYLAPRLSASIANRIIGEIEDRVTSRAAAELDRVASDINAVVERRLEPFTVYEPSVPRAVVLPSDLQTISICGHGLPSFDLVVSRDPGPYDQLQIKHRSYSQIARVLNAELRGTGTLIDLGANIGSISLPVAACGSHVIAVEMLPQNCLKLKFAALVNGYRKLHVVQAAVSEQDGLLYYAGEEAWARVGGTAGAQALALRLDTILADLARENPSLLRPPFVLKIDVEGHELQALMGADRLLAEHQPTIIFESVESGSAVDRTRECKEFLTARGYALFLLRGNLLAPRMADDPQEDLVADYLALPRGLADQLPAMHPGMEFRQPTTTERLRWFREQWEAGPAHWKHACDAMDAIAARDAEFARAAGAFRREIEKAPLPA